MSPPTPPLPVVRRRRETTTDDLEAALIATPDHAGRVADTLLVRRAIADLPEAFREALVLREIGDLTYKEIARHQGIGVQTVKSRLSRARSALADALASGAAGV